MKRFGLVCFVSLTLALVLSGCASYPALSDVMPEEEDSSIAGIYQLKPLDPLQISLLGIPEEKILDIIINDPFRDQCFCRRK